MSGSQKLVIVVAQGLMAHEVMTGTYPVLKVLQQVASSDLVDIFYAASFGMPLFNRNMVETSGWNMAIAHIPYKNLHMGDMNSYEDEDYIRDQLYIMVPKTLHEQAELFLRRSTERNSKPEQPFSTLDLSMGSHPEKVFSHLKGHYRVKKVKTLDLSWCAMPAKEQRDIFLAEAKEIGIKNIILSGFEDWFNDLESYIIQNNLFNIYKRKDAGFASEVPSIPPYLARVILKTPKFEEPYFTIPLQSVAVSSEASAMTKERQHSPPTRDPLLELQLPLAGSNSIVFDPIPMSNTITVSPTQAHRSPLPSPLAIVKDHCELRATDSWEQELQCIIERSSSRDSESHQNTVEK